MATALAPAARNERLAWAAVLALALAGWHGVPRGTFHFDDFHHVVRDEATHALPALLERLPDGLRPLTRLTYFADAALFGEQAAAFLRTNLVLFLACAFLTGLAVRRRFGPTAGLLTTALVVAQPACAEAVAYVSGRSSLLMATLLAGALLAVEHRRLALAGVLAALAVAAKETALCFPLLLLAWETGRPKDQALPRATWLRVVALALALTAALFAFHRYRELARVSPLVRPFGETVLGNLQALPQTLSLLVRPWALSIDHGVVATPSGEVLGAVALAVAVTAAFALRRKAPLVSLAVGWALAALLPTSSVLPKADLVAEKVLLLAWLGPAAALGAFLGPRLRLAGAVALGLVLGASSAAAAFRVEDFADDVQLWTRAVRVNPAHARAWRNLGTALIGAHRPCDGIVALDRAIALSPDRAPDLAPYDVYREECTPRP
ncbi:MAG: hypothetical protein K1X89_00270 [Myxococcaceae bacterium]|nr:hypothetical protein [Myxococcaceae bacterium]